MLEPRIKRNRWNKYYPLYAVVSFDAFLAARSIRHGLDTNAIVIAILLSLLFLLINWGFDMGRKWRAKPEEIVFAGFILLILGRGAYNVTGLLQEAETVRPAVEHAAMILGCSSFLVVVFLLLRCLKGRKRWTP